MAFSDWLIVPLVLFAALALGRCWVMFLKGERPSGFCKLCLLVSAIMYAAWSKHWFGLDRLARYVFDSIDLPGSWLAPDSDLGTLVLAVMIFIPVFALAHLLAWLVRRWDRQRYSRRPQFLHGSRFLWMYFPDKGTDGGAWNGSDTVDLGTADCGGGGFDAGDAGGTD